MTCNARQLKPVAVDVRSPGSVGRAVTGLSIVGGYRQRGRGAARLTGGARWREPVRRGPLELRRPVASRQRPLSLVEPVSSDDCSGR